MVCFICIIFGQRKYISVHMVLYVLPMEVYLGGMCGSPCCRVLTVSNECINMSPVVPPIPPASIACSIRSIELDTRLVRDGGVHGYTAAGPAHGRPRRPLRASSLSYSAAIRGCPWHSLWLPDHHLRVCSESKGQTSRIGFLRPWAMQERRMGVPIPEKQ